MKNEEFTAVYEKYQDMVMKIIYKNSRDMELAQEISQQVFVSFYKVMDNIEQPNYKRWLIVAARNAFIDYIRKRKHQTKYLDDLERHERAKVDYQVVTKDQVEFVVERLANEQLAFRILEEIREKNHEWYEVLHAVCICEMKPQEAAKHLDISADVLRARLSRVRKYIRKKYLDEYKKDY